MADLNIIKGHDIQISGLPIAELNASDKPKTVAIKPYQFKGIKPKLLVKEGDTVKTVSYTHLTLPTTPYV